VVENQRKKQKKEKKAKNRFFRDASNYVDTCITLIYQGFRSTGDRYPGLSFSECYPSRWRRILLRV